MKNLSKGFKEGYYDEDDELMEEYYRGFWGFIKRLFRIKKCTKN